MAASKVKPLMDAKVRHEDPKKGLHDVRSFIGACNFYHRHIKNFIYPCPVLTDLIKKSTTWRSGPQEQQAFDELKDKVAKAKCLGLPGAEGEIFLLTDTSHTGGGGTLFQLQALEKEEFNSAISQWRTDGLSRDSSTATLTTNGSLFPRVIGTGNGTRPGVTALPTSRNCSRGCLCYLLSPHCRGATQWFGCATKNRSAPSIKGPPHEKAKLRRWWTYLRQLWLSVHHNQGVKNESAD